MNQFLDAALKYAKFDWHVFPLAPGQKIPITKHGVKDATRDASQIRAWWQQWPNANVAVACGIISGVYVIDVDVTESGDVNGYDSLKEFQPIPKTVTQATPRGGFHAFYRTDDPPANKNSFRPGIDIRGNGYYVVVAPSIHPNGGQYAWAPDQAPGEIEIAEFPDSMRPVTRSPWVSAPAMKVPMAPIVGPTSDHQIQRASAYLAECEPAVQGQAGHNSLFWAASSIMHRFGLSDSQVYDLLAREYNPSCQPPWDLSIPKDEKDFRRKISEARKNPPAKAAEWAREEALEHGEVSQAVRDGVAQILATNLAGQVEPEQPPAVLLGSSELQALYSPPGMIGELCDWINETALCKQPFLTLACSLAFCGALFGRKVRDSIGTRTNLYCMGGADSSAGKNHPPNQIRNLCTAAGCLDLLGGDTAASDAGIEERMSRQPSTLFLWDEIGFLLRSVKERANLHTAQVVSLLMRLYSASGAIYTGREYADADKQRTIIQPCCCLYGSSSPLRFVEGITPNELQDGWLSRCLVFRVHETPRKTRSKCDIPPPLSLCEQVTAWFTRQVQSNGGDIENHAIFRGTTGEASSLPSAQIIVPRTKRAEQVFIALDNESYQFGLDHPHLACLWRKAEENARKIGLILAASTNFERPEITESIADYSCRLVRYLLLSFGQDTAPEIVTCRVDLEKQKLLKIISEHGAKGCLHRTLTRCSQHLNKKERDSFIADMKDAGIVAFELKGRTVLYWTAEDYRKRLGEQATSE
jgi:hypothetical protein